MAVLASGRGRRRHPPALAAALVLGLALGLLSPSRPAADPGERSREYAVKVALLFKVALFVEWPPPAGDPRAPFVIGVLGRDPFGPLLEETMAGEEVDGRPCQVVRSQRLEPLAGYQILFISDSEQGRLASILAGVRGHHVLTVGDSPEFCEKGGMVNLRIREGKVKIELNRTEAEREQLHVNSKLVQLANLVETDAGAGAGRGDAP
jgi:YfiR/HmsC-like